MTDIPDGAEVFETDLNRAVILDRSDLVPDPPYEVVARTKCLRCDNWCWLDPDTLRAVAGNGVSPLCLPCSRGVVSEQSFIGNAKDMP